MPIDSTVSGSIGDDISLTGLLFGHTDFDSKELGLTKEEVMDIHGGNRPGAIPSEQQEMVHITQCREV